MEFAIWFVIAAVAIVIVFILATGAKKGVPEFEERKEEEPAAPEPEEKPTAPVFEEKPIEPETPAEEEKPEGPAEKKEGPFGV